MNIDSAEEPAAASPVSAPRASISDYGISLRTTPCKEDQQRRAALPKKARHTPPPVLPGSFGITRSSVFRERRRAE